MFKATWGTANTIATILGALSILLLIDHGAKVGWIPLIEVLLSYYQTIKDLILAPIALIASQFIEWLSKAIGVDLELQPHWSDVFVLMSLYLGSRARSYWKANLKKRAVFRFFLGSMVGLFIGVAAGAISLESMYSNIILFAIVLIGMAIFDLVDAVWSATFHRKEGLTWVKDFFRYLAFSAPAIGIGLFFLLLFWFKYGRWSQDFVLRPGIIALLFYSAVLAFYWIFRGLQSSRSREKPGTGYEKFIASSNSQIGFLMMRSLGGAFLILAFNAGYILIGP